MNPQAYKNAYDTAVNELTGIAETFEKLRVRKAQIESLVLALQPFFGEGQAPAATHEHPGAVVPEIAASQAEPPEGYSFRDVPNPLPIFLVVDISASGNFGSGVMAKRDLAAEVASVLAFSAIRTHPRAGCRPKRGSGCSSTA